MKSPSYYALLFTLAIFVQSPASASSNRTAGVCPSAAVRIVGTTDPELTGADLQAMCSVINDEASPQATARVSPALDWENAFGIRYTDLKKRDAFYAQIVKPLQTSDTDTTLEIKIRALAPGVAVADEYWHIVGQLDTTTRKPGPTFSNALPTSDRRTTSTSTYCPHRSRFRRNCSTNGRAGTRSPAAKVSSLFPGPERRSTWSVEASTLPEYRFPIRRC
jgi:hypothetical protein